MGSELDRALSRWATHSCSTTFSISTPHLLGYRVLWANDSTHEFSSRTNEIWMDTTFVDTVSLNTLTRNVYYRIVAVDTRYHHSAPSDILELVRPDVVPPVAPIFTDVYVTETSVALR
jgi:hypothetical protein